MTPTRTLLTLALIMAAFTSVTSVSLSSRLRAKQATPSNIEQCAVNGTNVTNVNIDEQINSYGQDFVNDTVNLRNGIDNILDYNNNWVVADENFTNIVTYLQALLRYADGDLYSVNIDVDNDFNNYTISQPNGNNAADNVNAVQSACAFLQDGDLPANNTQCADAFDTLEPHFINFANAANNQNVKYALYWLLQALPGLPELSNNCYNTGLNLPDEEFDREECEEEIEDLVDVIGDLRAGTINNLNRASRVRRMITSRIPEVLANCLGTEN